MNGLIIESNEVIELDEELSEDEVDIIEDEVVITDDVSDEYKEQYPAEFFTYSTYDGLEVAEAIKEKEFFREMTHTIYESPANMRDSHEIATYAYHPNYSIRKVIEHDDAERFGSDDNLLLYEKHFKKVRKITGNFNKNEMVFKNNIVYIYGSRGMYGTKGTYTSLRETGFSNSRLTDGTIDTTDLYINYPEDDEVDITIIGDFYEDLELALEITLVNVFDEERQDRIASFISHVIRERYTNEDNPLSIETKFDKYNTEFYVDGYYIAFEQSKYWRAGDRKPLLNILIR